MTYTARIVSKLVLHKQTCFSLKDLVWAFSMYTTQGCDSGWDSQMTLFWNSVLGQKGQISIFFGPVQGAGKLAATPKRALVPWILLGLKKEFAVPLEPEMELACAYIESQPVARASLAKVRGDMSKSKRAATSPSSSSPAFPQATNCLELQNQNVFSTAPALLLCASRKRLAPNVSRYVASHSPPLFTIPRDEHFCHPWPSAFSLLWTKIMSFAMPWEHAGWEQEPCDSMVCEVFELALIVIGIIRVSTVPRSLTHRWVEAWDLPSHRELACVLGLTETSVKGNNWSALSQSYRQSCLSTCLRSSQHIINEQLYISWGVGDGGKFFLNLSFLMQWSFLDGKSGKYPTLGDKGRGLTWHYIHSKC